MRRLVTLVVLAAWSSVASAGPLQSVDWCNRGYGPHGPRLTKCTGGVEQRHRSGEGMWGTNNYQFRYASYGDLTSDGSEDALVVMCSALVPVLLEPKAKTRPARGALYLIVQRGTDLVISLVWLDGKRRCTETWTFTGEASRRTSLRAPASSASQRGPEPQHRLLMDGSVACESDALPQLDSWTRMPM